VEWPSSAHRTLITCWNPCPYWKTGARYVPTHVATTARKKVSCAPDQHSPLLQTLSLSRVLVSLRTPLACAHQTRRVKQAELSDPRGNLFCPSATIMHNETFSLEPLTSVPHADEHGRLAATLSFAAARP